MTEKIKPMPIKQTLNKDIGLRFMWKYFSEVGRGSPREGEIVGHLSVRKARQKQGRDRDRSKRQ